MSSKLEIFRLHTIDAYSRQLFQKIFLGLFKKYATLFSLYSENYSSPYSNIIIDRSPLIVHFLN
jgi:hypothetical protein